MDVEKREFYRRYMRHYGQKIIETASDETVIDGLISDQDLVSLFNALRNLIEVDWEIEEINQDDNLRS